jgi:hypothetical protein
LPIRSVKPILSFYARCPVAERTASEELVWIQYRVLLAGRRYLEWMAEIIDWLLKAYRAG